MTIHPDRLAKLLSDDDRTGGHALGEDVQKLTDDEVVSLSNILEHWGWVVSRELTRRAGLRRG